MRVYPCLSIPTFPSHIDLGTQKVFQPDCGRVTGQSGERTRADKEETEKESQGLEAFGTRKFLYWNRLREDQCFPQGHSPPHLECPKF